MCFLSSIVCITSSGKFDSQKRRKIKIKKKNKKKLKEVLNFPIDVLLPYIRNKNRYLFFAQDSLVPFSFITLTHTQSH